MPEPVDTVDHPASAASPQGAPAPSLRVMSEGLSTGAASGILGLIIGLVSAYVWPSLPLSGDGSFGQLAAVSAGVVAAASTGVGYWRSRHSAGQEWRLTLAPWKFTVNTISVVVVHTILAMLATLALYYVLGLAFIGLTMVPFWSATLLAITLGLAGHLTYTSSSRMTTQRMSSLLMAFVLIGVLTSMVTTTDPDWWLLHFSQLGTFDSISSVVFNGTLIAGGLLVTTFAVYVGNDMRVLVDRGLLGNTKSPRTVSVLFVVMGIMLAGVGLVPVDVNLAIHNLSATGMAIVYASLLIAAPRLFKGMPRTFFVTSWGFLAATVLSVALFVSTYFGLTAFEIIVFALVFAWIATFIRFLGVTAQRIASQQ
ncbi:hypothetical protein [Microbacterium sp. P5_E9]